MMNARSLALHTWTLDTTPLPELLLVVRNTGWGDGLVVELTPDPPAPPAPG